MWNDISNKIKWQETLASLGLIVLVIVFINRLDSDAINRKDEQISYLETQLEMSKQNEILNEEVLTQTIETLNKTMIKNDILFDKNEELMDRIEQMEYELEELKNEKVELQALCEKDVEERTFTNSSNRYFDETDIEILERITESEATGCTVEQKMNVAWNVVNRVVSNKFSNDVQGVVFQHNQYSPIYDGRYYEVSITNSTKEAVLNVLNNKGKHDGLFFMAEKHADAENVSWFKANLEFLFNDGVHSHYK